MNVMIKKYNNLLDVDIGIRGSGRTVYSQLSNCGQKLNKLLKFNISATVWDDQRRKKQILLKTAKGKIKIVKTACSLKRRSSYLPKIIGKL